MRYSQPNHSIGAASGSSQALGRYARVAGQSVPCLAWKWCAETSFEDRRARAVGDVLQVVLKESTAANRSIGNQASRDSTVELTVEPGAAGTSPLGKALKGANLNAGAKMDFQGAGASSARNAFTGVLMVMVTQVLSNGNLVVSGEKQIAIGAEEEVIRFSGIINPSDLTNNSVLSTQVADARLEYRGRGIGDDATRPGWLSRGLMKVWPF